MTHRLLEPKDAQPMLEHFATLNKRTQAKRKLAAAPEVGIFFVYEGKLLLDGTLLSEAQNYGAFKGHGTGHDSFWKTLQRNDLVPRDVEYDEAPRGRVGYDMKERKFYIFADPCILKDQRMMDRITRDFNLPMANTAPPRKDSHYKCPGCRPKKTKEQLAQEEADWDF